MPLKPVDAAIKIIVGPAIDDTDFKTREEALTYDQAGIEVDVILEKYDGTIVTTAVTPTTGGDYDWAHTNQGYYELELPASGGASFNNTEEGIITIAVFCTGVLPFRSVSYDIIESQAYDALIKGTDSLQVDAVQISSDTVTADNVQSAFNGTGYGFTNCTMPTVSTLTGHTAQTGDNFTRLGAPIGASISADLVVIDNFVDELETRLSAARAGYLDELAAANIPADVDTLLTRLTAARAGYLDNLSAGAVALASIATEARLAELDAANIPARTDGIQTDLDNATDGLGALKALIDTIDGIVDTILVDTNELQTDWVNGGRLDLLLDACALEATVAALNNISASDVNAQVVDVIKTDTTSEMSQGAPPATPTFEEMVAYLYFKMRNKQETTATEDAIYDDAGTTKLFKSSISDDTTTFTKGKYVSGA